MTPAYPITHDEIGRSYAVLRQGGAPSTRAQAELGLTAPAARQLETWFRRARSVAAACGRPAFAHHRSHVAAVVAAGGYPGAAR